MSNFRQISKEIDVRSALADIDACPHLWDLLPHRRAAPDSPHRETSDIWLRWAAGELIDCPLLNTGPFPFRFYPAWRELPGLGFVYDHVLSRVRAEEIGGILLTRIPAGKQVYPHSDTGGWHQEHFNLKVWVPLRANPGCVNTCGDEAVVMEPGSAWTFDNGIVHAVRNEGDSERICLILCFRGELL